MSARNLKSAVLSRCLMALSLFAIAYGVASCTSTNTQARYMAVSTQMPPIPRGESRIFIYHPKIRSAGHVRVYLNEARMPDIYSGKFYFVDVPAGSHKISSAFNPGFPSPDFGKDSINVDLHDGEVIYVQPTLRNSIPISSRIFNVPSRSARNDIVETSYLGTMPPRSSKPI